MKPSTSDDESTWEPLNAKSTSEIAKPRSQMIAIARYANYAAHTTKTTAIRKIQSAGRAVFSSRHRPD